MSRITSGRFKAENVIQIAPRSNFRNHIEGVHRILFLFANLSLQVGFFFARCEKMGGTSERAFRGTALQSRDR